MSRKPTGIQAQNIKLRAHGFHWKNVGHWNEHIKMVVHTWTLYDAQGQVWDKNEALAAITRKEKAEKLAAKLPVVK
jgi:hypothetical protein